jgi:arogenate/prephenate dehydratase
MKIAYQGEPGAFSEAASRLVSADAALIPCKAFEEVFERVEQGPAQYGVLPIENSIGGSIHRNYDLLMENHLPIVGEVEVPVVHHLLALPGATLDGIKRVYSHPQALAQCERFLRKLTDTAAIASARAGEIFGLAPLASSIQDFNDNITRFIVIGRRPLNDTPPDKTTIVFSLPNEPGSLFKALSAFALRGVDLTKLESRPIPGRPWEYLFYADLASARDELPCQRALAHLAEFAPVLRTLGSYTRWKGQPS